MKVKVNKFEMIVGEKGIVVVDHRYKPGRRCGRLSWKTIMKLIEDEFIAPAILPCGPKLY